MQTHLDVSGNITRMNPIIILTFKIYHTKPYVPVVTLSTQDNEKLLQQLNSGFKRAFNCNKYLSKPELLKQNPNLNYLANPSFNGVNRVFALAFENDAHRTSYSFYHLLFITLL